MPNENNYKKCTRFSVLLVAILFIAQIVIAEDKSDKEQQNKEKVVKQSQSYKSKRSRIKTLEEFIPSEEVSADKPVAFPSDI